MFNVNIVVNRLNYGRLQWQRLTHDRPDLSSERAPQKDKTVTLRKNTFWSNVPDLGLTPRHTDWLTVSRNVTLTLTLTLTLTRVVQPSARGYNRDTLFLGDINTGTWPSRLGSLKLDSKMKSWVLRELDRRVTANYTSKLQTRPLVKEGAPQHEVRNVWE
jgi:hypothetical protein